MRRRHRGVLLSFLLCVLFPFLAAGAYLFAVADDQYASRAGFSVRSEDISSAQSLLGGLADSLSGTSSSDTDILYEFIQSQSMVEKINARLDLPVLYSKPAFDPVFAYNPGGTIEDLVDYWRRMVKVSYTSGTGLIELRVNAFTPEDAQRIGLAIVDESSKMINELSAIARDDATRYAREDLEQTVTRLKQARQALTQFRSETRIVDPTADIQGQMGLLNSLETQLAESYIELNLLLDKAQQSDPRVETSQRRIEVIKSLIEQERQKFGVGGSARTDDEQDYSTLVGEYEQLSVDVQYAQETYLAAQTMLDTAQAEAQRQSRYLATYAQPSLPQSARYPQRGLLTLATGIFLILGWSIGVLIFYSLRDRR